MLSVRRLLRQVFSPKNVDRFLSTKFLLTLACLVGVFVLKFSGKNVDDLAIVLPGILAFYVGGNVLQSAVDQDRFRRTRRQDFPPPQEQENYNGTNNYPSRRHYGS